MNPQHQQKRKIRQSCRHKFYPQPLFIAFFNVSHKRPTFAFTSESGRTHSAFGERSHTAAHTAKHGPPGRGRYHYPRHELHVHKHPRAGCQNGVLCRFWVLVGCAPEERRKPAGQRCAHARRCPAGVAAPLGCVIFLLLSKCRTAACQSGSFAIFRGQVGVVPRTIPIFLRIHRIFCWQFQLQTLLRYGKK